MSCNFLALIQVYYPNLRTVKNQFAFHLLVLTLFFSFQACKKDSSTPDPLGQDDPLTKKIDSGTYNPNSYFPLKMGSYWIYEHLDNTLDTVRCSEVKSGVVANNYGKYDFTFHELSSNDLGTGLGTLEPVMSGRFNSASRPGYICDKGGYISKTFMVGNSLGPKEYYVAYTCGGSGFPRTNDVYICIDSNITYMGFPNVMQYAFTDAQNISKFDTSLNCRSLCVMLPLELKTNSDYTLSWYAKGVGLIRTERYLNGVLSDVMVLKSYSIPH